MSVAIGGFLVFGASQVGTPGPANMVLMSAGARYGFRSALPFVCGVVLGKQLIIWPIGFGLMELAQIYPFAFQILKWLCAAYIFWLAWKIANLRFGSREGLSRAPGFWDGLAVHPVNPKAWAMIVTGFTSFTSPGTPAFTATATIAGCLLLLQIVLHPIWTYAGDWIARKLAGSAAEKYLMWTLSVATVASVMFVIFGGEVL